MAVSDKLARYREVSPINYLKKESPPLLMIQGDKDTTIPVKHAYFIQQKAESIQAPVEIMIVKNAGHNWRKVDADIVPSREWIIERTVKFFVDHRAGTQWDRVPLNIHFGKRSSDLTGDEVDFIADHSNLIVLEKSHGLSAHGSTEAGIADSARRITARNPDAKVLFYFNAFINWPGYNAFKTYRDEWTLRDKNGNVVKHTSGTPRPDPSNAEFREWWSGVVAKANRSAPLGGVFIDALPQALAPALAAQVGEAKAGEVEAGLREMIALTKRKLGPKSIVLANGLRTTDFREILDWDGIDGVMIEHFGVLKTAQPEAMKADLDSIAVAAAKGKFVVIKGWPGFTWLERDMMKRPQADLLAISRERITFPLACFLIGANDSSYFCYSWGYRDQHGMLDSYSEFDRPLGPPKSDAVWHGLNATREFENASVSIDLNKKQARIDWNHK